MDVKQVQINVVKPFTLVGDHTLPDPFGEGTRTDFAIGPINVPEDVAEHWFVQAHLMGARQAGDPAPPPAADPSAGLAAFDAALERAMDEMAREIGKLDDVSARVQALADAAQAAADAAKADREAITSLLEEVTAQRKAIDAAAQGIADNLAATAEAAADAAKAEQASDNGKGGKTAK